MAGLRLKKAVPGKLIGGRFVPAGKPSKRKAKKTKGRKNGLFSFIGKAKRRAGKGYMVLDREGLPVHTGRNLSKREALSIAKEARKDGEKGIHLVRMKN
jgi:hypothetical protein